MTSKSLRRFVPAFFAAVLGGFAVVSPALVATVPAGPARAADPPKWAGLYYEPRTGKSGWARPFDTRREARTAAYNAAVANGINPKRYRGWARQVRGGCIFVFKELDAFHWGAAVHRNKDTARRVARARCERRGKYRCRERVWVCSARGF
jgi:hypothetical protein